MTSLDTFLSKFQVHEKNGAFNFTRYSTPYGKFNIPDDKLDAFHKSYAKHINLKGSTPSLTEKNGIYSPVLVDIDLKYPMGTPLEKHYDINVVKIIAQSYFDFFSTYIDIYDVSCYVQERTAPYADKNGIVKDGFHIIMPDVRGATLLKEKAREHVMKECKDVLLGLGTINTIDDIVDKAVVSSNGWFVYGSGKPNATPYLVTHVWDRDLNDVEYDKSVIKIVKRLSIQSDHETVKWLDGAEDKFQKKYSLASAGKKKDSTRIDRTVKSAVSVPQAVGLSASEQIPFELLEKVVMGLDDVRAVSEPEWIQIVWPILHTAQANGYRARGRNLIHQFSKKCPEKYDEDLIEEKIDRQKNRDDGLKFASLKHFLRKDNPELFQELCGPPRDYLSVKQDFELTHFKTMEPTGLYREGKSGILPKRRKEICEDFENLYYLEQTGDRIVKKPFLKRWFADENIRTYRTIDFLPPPCECPDDTYNLFTGLRAASLPAADSVDLTLIFDLISKLCGNDQAVIEYHLNWLAQLIHEPGRLSRTGLLWQSDEGVGKNLFLDWLGKSIIGDSYYFTTTNIDDLFGTFAVGLKNKLLVNMNEATAADTTRYVERIKSAITDVTINYQAKYMNTVVLQNFCRFVFSTNNKRAIQCGASERRWVASECDNSRCNDRSYFAPISRAMNDKTARAFYDFLIDRDVSEWDPTKRPYTRLYRELQAASIPVLSKWMVQLVEIGNDIDDESSGSLYDLYKDWYFTSKLHKTAPICTKASFGSDIKLYGGVAFHRSNGSKYSISIVQLESYLRSKGCIYDDAPLFLDDD